MRIQTFAAAALPALILAACSDGAAPTGSEPTAPVTEISPSPEPEPGDTPTDATNESDAADANTLTARGIGPVRIGMTRDQLTAAWGPDANPGAVGGPEPESCDIYHPKNAPEGVLVMLIDGKLDRITLGDESDIATDKGLRVGAAPEKVKVAYGASLIAEPHKYEAVPAQYLTYWATGQTGGAYVQDESARGIRYVVDRNGKVAQIHAGGPSIQLVEGCS